MNETAVKKEIKYRAIRSGGPGGQHANKVSSKVVAQFDLFGSAALTEEEKLLMSDKLKYRLSSSGLLVLSCDTSRSQHQNKALVTDRLLSILAGSLKRSPKRIPTKISKSAKIRRVKRKMKHSDKKALRRKPNIE